MSASTGRVGQITRCVSCSKAFNSIHLSDGACSDCRLKKRAHTSSRRRVASGIGVHVAGATQPGDIVRQCQADGWHKTVDEGGHQVWHTFSKDGRYLRLAITPDQIWFAMAPTKTEPRTSALTSYVYGKEVAGADAMDIEEIAHRMTLEREPNSVGS